MVAWPECEGVPATSDDTFSTPDLLANNDRAPKTRMKQMKQCFRVKEDEEEEVFGAHIGRLSSSSRNGFGTRRFPGVLNILGGGGEVGEQRTGFWNQRRIAGCWNGRGGQGGETDDDEDFPFRCGVD